MNLIPLPSTIKVLFLKCIYISRYYLFCYKFFMGAICRVSQCPVQIMKKIVMSFVPLLKIKMFTIFLNIFFYKLTS